MPFADDKVRMFRIAHCALEGLPSQSSSTHILRVGVCVRVFELMYSSLVLVDIINADAAVRRCPTGRSTRRSACQPNHHHQQLSAGVAHAVLLPSPKPKLNW